MNILHIIPNLDYCGAAAQLGLLAKHLPGKCNQRIVCLGSPGPWALRLLLHGRRVDCLHWTRVFDPAPLWKLRRLLADEPPDVIHAWSLPALRALAIAGRRWLPKTVVSNLSPGQGSALGRIDRWLLGRVRLVTASCGADADALRQAGIDTNSLDIVPPGVEIPMPAEPTAQDPTSRSAPRILCVGALERRNAFRDAIWSFDMLLFVVKESRLQFAGDGPERAQLAWFASCMRSARQVEFLGRRDDVPRLLTVAYVCWSPSATASNRQVVLEAMAAGRPVIAADRPGLPELMTDGQTGFIYPAGDKVGLCKRTRQLMHDPDLARAVGTAARQQAAQHFGAEANAARWTQLYAVAA